MVGNVFDKVINKLRPFSSNGRGFKDAMIWEHVKWIVNTYCNEYRELAFVTNNLEDFCDKPAQSSGDVWYYPAEHLIKEYSDSGYDKDTVRIYKDLKTFCFDIVRDKVNQYNKYLDELNTINNTYLKKL